jgi:hypothetical protein
MSKRKSTYNGEELSRKSQSSSNSSNSAGKKRSLPINLDSDETDVDDEIPSRSTEVTNQSSSAPAKGIN